MSKLLKEVGINTIKIILAVGTKHTYKLWQRYNSNILNNELFVDVVDQTRFCHVDQASVSVVGP